MKTSYLKIANDLLGILTNYELFPQIRKVDLIPCNPQSARYSFIHKVRSMKTLSYTISLNLDEYTHLIKSDDSSIQIQFYCPTDPDVKSYQYLNVEVSSRAVIIYRSNL